MRFSFVWGIVALLFLSEHIQAYECEIGFVNSHNYPMDNSYEIQENLLNYFSSAPFHPFFKDHNLKYAITNIFQENGLLIVAGFLSQGENQILAFFSIDKGWFSTATNLLFMTTELFNPSMELFQDLRRATQAYINKHISKNLSNHHILIQKHDNRFFQQGNEHTWSFYNSEEIIQFLIITQPAIDGGTDFAIHSMEIYKWTD